ncbi:hypothetical protein [Amycolatopsis australiensis]|uniref:Uncharacterized protein n=1 Tax=Amycolatopsis australiensis TaxID=546364 RepID=A0A1K1S0F2_9PSEU|nr:hypothetical protein [Amycolatopsis australiensis]SFW77843.1 hypothetical protein SAMN04489730_4392 [Amycolatopsis australiensis]
MTRRARRRDRISVDELLRRTGTRPRRPGSRSAEAARRDPGFEPRGGVDRRELRGGVAGQAAGSGRLGGADGRDPGGEVRGGAAWQAAGFGPFGSSHRDDPSREQCAPARRSRFESHRAAVRDSGFEPRGAAGRIALASAVFVVLGGVVLALATRPDPVPGSTRFPQLPPATGLPTSTAVAAPTRTTTPSPVVMHARKTPTPTPTVTVLLPPSPTTTVTLPPPTWDYGCHPYGCRSGGTPVR